LLVPEFSRVFARDQMFHLGTGRVEEGVFKIESAAGARVSARYFAADIADPAARLRVDMRRRL
jgi:hypothetical protein